MVTFDLKLSADADEIVWYNRWRGVASYLFYLHAPFIRSDVKLKGGTYDDSMLFFYDKLVSTLVKFYNQHLLQ